MVQFVFPKPDRELPTAASIASELNRGGLAKHTDTATLGQLLERPSQIEFVARELDMGPAGGGVTNTRQLATLLLDAGLVKNPERARVEGSNSPSTTSRAHTEGEVQWPLLSSAADTAPHRRNSFFAHESTKVHTHPAQDSTTRAAHTEIVAHDAAPTSQISATISTLLSRCSEIGSAILKQPDVFIRLCGATLATGGKITPAVVNGELMARIKTGSDIRPDEKQPSEYDRRGEKNPFFGMYAALQATYAERGEKLTTIGPRQFAELGIKDGCPAIYVSPFGGDQKLLNHHRIWAVTDNPKLGLAIYAYVDRDPTSYS